MSVLSARVTVGYRLGRRRRRVVLSDVHVGLHAGDLVCLLGPNGTGKSTLLRTLAGTLQPLDGEVRLGADTLAQLSPREVARRIGVVLTDPVEVGLLSVYDLVALGRYPHTDWIGRLSATDRDAVEWALRVTRTDVFRDRRVGELSDGERQRVLIARALAQQPAVLLLDEPTAFVDLPRRVELTGLLRGLARETGIAVLLTTHDLDLALRLADTLWLLDPAGSVHIGAPEDLVLSGAIGAAFGTDELAFDRDSGTFRPAHVAVATARVTGSGAAAHWARRALEREGFEVVESGPAEVEVTVTSDDRWSLHAYGRRSDHATVAAWVAELRRDRRGDQLELERTP